jgi:hypothetical protein
MFFSSTKLESKRAKQVLPGSEGVGGYREGRGRVRGIGERWPKQCIHI